MFFLTIIHAFIHFFRFFNSCSFYSRIRTHSLSSLPYSCASSLLLTCLLTGLFINFFFPDFTHLFTYPFVHSFYQLFFSLIHQPICSLTHALSSFRPFLELIYSLTHLCIQFLYSIFLLTLPHFLSLPHFFTHFFTHSLDILIPSVLHFFTRLFIHSLNILIPCLPHFFTHLFSHSLSILIPSLPHFITHLFAHSHSFSLSLVPSLPHFYSPLHSLISYPTVLFLRPCDRGMKPECQYPPKKGCSRLVLYTVLHQNREQRLKDKKIQP